MLIKYMLRSSSLATKPASMGWKHIKESDSTKMGTQIKLECNLRGFTHKQKSIPTTHSPLCNSSIFIHFGVKKWLHSSENVLKRMPFTYRILVVQEMIDFLVDVWEQEGLYD
ncbi:hypothetical protein Tsubulata_007771 [Turnera subulata]|uniref:DUF4050 domain-containing protein n=1 Tax=Turnera subulata TaxID=218843 RepID=A0A9Q0FWM5_9ROSI|nr:hypothetical protein Tsubulata_007771 [Turnera subulata]